MMIWVNQMMMPTMMVVKLIGQLMMIATMMMLTMIAKTMMIAKMAI